MSKLDYFVDLDNPWMWVAEDEIRVAARLRLNPTSSYAQLCLFHREDLDQ